jgi:uncharacterized protein (DUF488 family)
MQSAEFRRAVEQLMLWMAQARIALMCAEAVPWRCHRSLIGDALTARRCGARIVSATKCSLIGQRPLPKFSERT